MYRMPLFSFCGMRKISQGKSLIVSGKMSVTDGTQEDPILACMTCNLVKYRVKKGSSDQNS